MSPPKRSMDIPANVLEDLKCGSCEGYLSRSPVYLQHDGAGVCGQCYAPKRPATRNTQYEAVAKLLKFPCKNQDLGCRETVPFEAKCQVGWCECCAPDKLACVYQTQACTYTDYPDKCTKHERYFCQQRTYCFICWERVSRGTLAAHYGSAHQDVTYRAGSTWRAEKTNFFGECCLLTSAAGTAVCKYSLSSLQFVLEVFIPLPGEQLHKFRCSVRVTNPATRHTRTFTPDLVYDSLYDWRIVLKKRHFPSWNVVFNVCVDIE